MNAAIFKCINASLSNSRYTRFYFIIMTAIILVGGKSRRMGVNKAFLKINGKTFLERQISLLKTIFNEILISANSPAEYEGFGIPVITDIYPDKGPLGGIYTALTNSSSDYSFIIACDMPFVEKSLISELADSIKGYDVVVPENGQYLEPLHAFYSKRCIVPIKKQIDSGNLRITDFFPLVNVKKVAIDKFISPNRYNNPLTNLNTPDEYKESKSGDNGSFI